MKEKIVVLGNGQDWCEKSLTDLKKRENVKIINSKYLCDLSKFQCFLARIHFSYKLNRIINIPLKSLWFKKVRQSIGEDNDNLIIIVYDRSFLSNNEKFIKYLRKCYKNCKIVYMFTNIVKISGASDYNLVNKLNNMYDVVYAFDSADSKKYNFNYSPLLYSKNIMDIEEKNKVFYVGRAKDRYNMLIDSYNKLKELNIDRKFYIFGVSDKEQKYPEEIEYNKYLSYEECLKNIQESSCLIDIIQGDSEGFTIKNCEAVYYDKLLITTNKKIKQTPFYDERYMLIIDSPKDITEDFFKNAGKVKYSDEAKAYFSIDTFLKKLYKDLKIDD